jgi:tRNA(Ile)-lysidine synthase
VRAAEAADTDFHSFDLNSMFAAARGVQHVAVAVSGGSDSMALLHLAKAWGDLDGVQVSAVTVDHGLRTESAEEALQVARWAAQIGVPLGVPHVILRWIGEKPQTGIQAAARAARYDLMSEWASKSGIDCLLTGHTLNDQAETVAMRLKRTTSAASIAGIRPEIMWNHVRVLRPLLQVKRETLRDLLRDLRQGWIDDPSNDNPVFERVRTRREIGGDVDALALQAGEAQVRVARAEAEAREYVSGHVAVYPEGYFSVARGGLSTLSAEAADHLLGRLMRSLGGGEALLAERQRLWAWIENKSNRRRTLGGVVIALRLHDILFMREPGRISRGDCLVPDSGTLVWDGRFEVSAPPGSKVIHAGAIENLQPIPRLPRTVVDGLPMVMTAAGSQVAAFGVPHSGLSIYARFLGLR